MFDLKVEKTEIRNMRDILGDATNKRKVDRATKQLFHNSIPSEKIDNIQQNIKEFFTKEETLIQFKQVSSFIEFLKEIREINILEVLNINTDINTVSNCIFLKDNFCWVSKSQNNHYRYFTRKRETEYSKSLDLMDLIEVVFDLGKGEIVPFVSNLLNIDLFNNEIELKFKEKQETKYNDNLDFFKNIEDIKECYPNLYKSIKDHTNFLEVFTVEGQSNVYSKELSYLGENVFFASSKHLEREIAKHFEITNESAYAFKSAKINKLLNYFSLLGLIEKVSMDDMPKRMLNKAISEAIHNRKANIVSHYIIFNIRDNIDALEVMAEELNTQKIRYSNITKNKISDTFGEIIANKVYVQTVQKGRFKELSKEGKLINNSLNKKRERELLENLSDNESEEVLIINKKALGKIIGIRRKKEDSKEMKGIVTSYGFDDEVIYKQGLLELGYKEEKVLEEVMSLFHDDSPCVIRLTMATKKIAFRVEEQLRKDFVEVFKDKQVNIGDLPIYLVDNIDFPEYIEKISII